jgi:arsenate reductase (glutaredoxin)
LARDYTTREFCPVSAYLSINVLEFANRRTVMSDKIKVYQKPTCSKCRTTIGRLKEQGAVFETINYYEKPLTFDELRKLIDKLGIAPRDLLRKGEQVYRDLKLAHREMTDDEIIELMVENPDLIQRPIVVKGKKAVLGRPPENVDQLL